MLSVALETYVSIPVGLHCPGFAPQASMFIGGERCLIVLLASATKRNYDFEYTSPTMGESISYSSNQNLSSNPSPGDATFDLNLEVATERIAFVSLPYDNQSMTSTLNGLTTKDHPQSEFRTWQVHEHVFTFYPLPKSAFRSSRGAGRIRHVDTHLMKMSWIRS